MKNKTTQLFILLLMIPLTGASVDIYVPSLPAITHFFNVPVTMVQLTVPIYMIGYSLSQLLIGSVSDSLGRRPVLIVGMLLFILASLLAAWSVNISMLLIMRFLQGVAVAAPGVVTRAVISDSYSQEEIPVITNYVTIAWALGPILAPVIGGYLQAYIGWQAAFYFLTLYSSGILLLIIKHLPETITYKHPFTLNTVVNNYRQVLSHKAFVAGTMILAIVYAIMVLFNVVGPFLIQRVLNYSPIVYGHVALLLGVSWFLGTVFNRWLLKRYQQSPLQLVLIVAITSSLVMLLFAIAGKLNLVVLSVPTMLILFCGATLFSACFGRCLIIFPKMAGVASSAIGSLFVGGASLAGILASFLKTHNQIPLATSYLLLMLIALLLYRLFMLKQS